MLKVLLDADIIFIGETHNCPISHWLEYEIASDVIKKSPKGLVLGAEMFESDNQLLVDEYAQGLISSDKFETEAKLWDNYWTDYARSLMAPLPIPYDKAAQDEAMFGFMQMMGGKNSGKSYFAEAQAIKDATMAWFISQNYDKKFIHFNGNFHSDNKGGIIPYLEKYLPGKTIVTICLARQDSLNSLEKENRGRADFIIVAPTDFPMSY